MAIFYALIRGGYNHYTEQGHWPPPLVWAVLYVCTPREISIRTHQHQNFQEGGGEKLPPSCRQCRPGSLRDRVPSPWPDPIEGRCIKIPRLYAALWWQLLDRNFQEPSEKAGEMGEVLFPVGMGRSWHQDLWEVLHGGGPVCPDFRVRVVG